MIYTAKIDYDNLEMTIEDILARAKQICTVYRVPFTNMEVKKTKRGRHVYMDLYNPETIVRDEDIVLIQLLMGSDVQREIFNTERVKQKTTPYWNVLFKSKYKAGIKKSWEVAEASFTIKYDKNEQIMTIRERIIKEK